MDERADDLIDRIYETMLHPEEWQWVVESFPAIFGGARSVHLALGEVVDRLPTGVLLIDAQRRVVVRNRMAELILGLDDGLRIDRNGVSATDSRGNAELQRLIADVLDPDSDGATATRRFVAISRPPRKRDFAPTTSPLLARSDNSDSSEIVAVLLVVDPGHLKRRPLGSWKRNRRFSADPTHEAAILIPP